MDSVSTTEPRDRRRSANAIKAGMRELGVQLSLLNRQVGARAGVNDPDLDVLDMIVRHGPLSPSALARLARLHPATMTGVLDRLEQGGWIVRERDANDRRAVVVRAQKAKSVDILRLYSGMNSEMDGILDGYDEGQLVAIADFIERTTEAGRLSVEQLAEQ
ncbi:MAG: MarR family transcriptional regulator [Rhodoglobus sp.]